MQTLEMETHEPEFYEVYRNLDDIVVDWNVPLDPSRLPPELEQKARDRGRPLRNLGIFGTSLIGGLCETAAVMDRSVTEVVSCGIFVSLLPALTTVGSRSLTKEGRKEVIQAARGRESFDWRRATLPLFSRLTIPANGDSIQAASYEELREAILGLPEDESPLSQVGVLERSNIDEYLQSIEEKRREIVLNFAESDSQWARHLHQDDLYEISIRELVWRDDAISWEDLETLKWLSLREKNLLIDDARMQANGCEEIIYAYPGLVAESIAKKYRRIHDLLPNLWSISHIIAEYKKGMEVSTDFLAKELGQLCVGITQLQQREIIFSGEK